MPTATQPAPSISSPRHPPAWHADDHVSRPPNRTPFPISTSRITTVYAEHTLVEAAVAMLRAALANPLNQRFIMLSEACAPLYPPEVMYVQLLSEDKVRMDACKESSGFTGR